MAQNLLQTCSHVVDISTEKIPLFNCRGATEIVILKSKTCKAVLLWTLVHFTSSQITDRYIGPCGNTQSKRMTVYNTCDGTHGHIDVNSQSSLHECCTNYSHTYFWMHNRYMFEFWRAKKSPLLHDCCKNGEEDRFADMNVLSDRTKEKSFNLPVDVLVPSLSKDLYTSVWCHYSPESGLRCHFHNLHYSPKNKEFIFVLSPRSVVYGIDDIKSLQTTLFLSSVAGHNAFPFHVTVVPQDVFMSSYTSRVISGKILILARFKPDNLQHVFHDDLIPLYFSVKELCSGSDTCLNELIVVFGDDNERNVYWEFYRILAREIMFLSELGSEDNQLWYCFKDANIGVNKLSVWYQYGFGKPQGPQLIGTFSGHLLREFADFMRKQLQIQSKESRRYTVVVISRKHNRKLLNEKELSVLIRKHLQMKTGDEYDMRIISLEEDSMSEIIGTISRARLLIGVHGAGLILGIFLPPSSVLVEIWPYGVNPNAATVYQTMCDLSDFRVTYIPWVNEDVINTVPHPEYPPRLGGLSHLSSRDEKRVLKGLDEGKIEFLVCCDTIEWLFRIYQDTTVLLVDDNARYNSVPFTDVLARVIQAWEEESDYSQIFQQYPSKVEKLTRSVWVDSQYKKLVLEWEDPWNLQHLKCDRTYFEVVLQVDGDSEARTYFVNSGMYTKELPSLVEGVNVWITCFCDDIEGSELYVRCNM